MKNLLNVSLIAMVLVVLIDIVFLAGGLGLAEDIISILDNIAQLLFDATVLIIIYYLIKKP